MTFGPRDPGRRVVPTRSPAENDVDAAHHLSEIPGRQLAHPLGEKGSEYNREAAAGNARATTVS